MNRAAFAIDNENAGSGAPWMHAACLLFILLAPFVGVHILFLLTFAVFLGLRSVGNLSSRTRGMMFLASSMSLMLMISVVFEWLPFSYHLYIILGAFAISIIGNRSPCFSEKAGKKEAAPYKQGVKGVNRKKLSLVRSSAFLGLRILAAFLAAGWLIYWQDLPVSYDFVFFLAVIGAVTGSLFESIPSKIDRNISVPLGAGMTMWIFEEFRYWVPPEKILIALAFSLFLGYLAYRTKIADISALLSAALIGVLIIVFSGLPWFVLLLTFFILGGGFTRYKYAYKESIGIAQEKCGIRSYENVFSNSMTALALAIAYGIFPEYGEAIIYAYLGTVATATGDTLASEIGTTAKGRPIMITTLKPAVPGVDGAVSGLGELAALLASGAIGLLAYAMGITDNLTLSLLLATAGGFLGTNVDSLLGATFQKKGLLSNSGVNFVAVFVGAVISGGLYFLINAFL